MTTFRFMSGVLTLAAIVVPAAIAGWRCQRSLAPRQLPLPLLAAIVIALGIVLVTSELLGAVGLFRPIPLLMGTWVVAGAVYLGVSRWAPAPEEPPEPEAPVSHLPGWLQVAALAATGGVAIRWLSLTLRSVQHGVNDIDSNQYHLPFAAEFAKSGWLTRYHPVWPDPVQLFYPANSEVLQAIGMMTMGRDVLTPLPNLAWFGVLLLAGWCAGIRDGVAPLTLLATAWIAGIPLLAFTNAGSALSDIAMLAFLAAAVALWRNGDGDLGWFAVAGLALGIAVASKLTIAPTAAALAVSMALLAPTRPRRTAIGVLAAALAVGCSFWFIRNLVRSGSPIPSLSLPLFPSVELPVVDRFGFTVADYLFDGEVWRTVFWPRVRQFFGWAGLFVAIAIALALPRVLRSRDRGILALAACGGVGLLGYLVVPAGAWGTEGEPNQILFWANLRYSLPGLLLLAMVAAMASGTADGRWRVTIGAFLGLGVVAQIPWPDEFPVERRYTVAAAVLAAALAGAIAALRFLPLSGRRKLIAVGLVVTVAVLGVGPTIARRQIATRADFAASGAGPAFAFAASEQDANFTYHSVLGSYPLYGPLLQNESEHLGVSGSRGSFRSVETCEEYLSVLERKGYEYVVVGPDYPFFNEIDVDSWTLSQPGTTVVVDDPDFPVYRVAPPYDPSACPIDP